MSSSAKDDSPNVRVTRNDAVVITDEVLQMIVVAVADPGLHTQAHSIVYLIIQVLC